MTGPMLEIKPPNLKRQAEDYLRYRGVAYNDLITGDHAADLLVHWARAMTSWDQEMQLRRLDEALMSLRMETTLTCGGKELQFGVDYKLEGNKLTLIQPEEPQP